MQYYFEMNCNFYFETVYCTLLFLHVIWNEMEVNPPEQPKLNLKPKPTLFLSFRVIKIISKPNPNKTWAPYLGSHHFKHGHFTLAQTIGSFRIGEAHNFETWMKGCHLQIWNFPNLQG